MGDDSHSLSNAIILESRLPSNLKSCFKYFSQLASVYRVLEIPKALACGRQSCLGQSLLLGQVGGLGTTTMVGLAVMVLTCVSFPFCEDRLLPKLVSHPNMSGQHFDSLVPFLQNEPIKSRNRTEYTQREARP